MLIEPALKKFEQIIKEIESHTELILVGKENSNEKDIVRMAHCEKHQANSQSIRKNKRKPSVFLSHSWDGKCFARKLAQRLRRNGVDVWIDEAELKVGTHLYIRFRKPSKKPIMLLQCYRKDLVHLGGCKKSSL